MTFCRLSVDSEPRRSPLDGEAAAHPHAAERLTWVSSPTLPALQSAWMLGTESQTGLYLLRVKLAPGGRIPPHLHPDERVTTVLSGTLYVGFGETFDTTKVTAISSGAVYVAPAEVSH